MWRPLATITLVIMAAALAWQQQAIFGLKSRVEIQEKELRHYASDLTRKQDLDQLFYKFILSNHRGIQDLKQKRLLTVTAYSPRTRETDDTPFQTASNRRVRQGIVAVSRDLFNNGWVFGRKIYIPGRGIYTIDDLMAEHKRNQIDIFMYDTDQAMAFGKQKLIVHLMSF